MRCEPEDARRIRPVRVALQNQRDDLLAFADVLDGKLAAIAHAQGIAEPLVREACVLHRLPSTSCAYWQGWNRLRTTLGTKFHPLFEAVSRTLAQTPRSSSLVENLNSRLRLTTYQFHPQVVDGHAWGVMKAGFWTGRVVGWVGSSMRPGASVLRWMSTCPGSARRSARTWRFWSRPC
jgi:hypothetical protein